MSCASGVPASRGSTRLVASPALDSSASEMIVLGGYTNAEIAAKIDLTPDYIAAICYLLEHGEECLLVAVERGVMPANVAMEIARASDGDIQQALAEAYENKLLPGNQILAIRRIILRATFGDIIQDTRSFDE